MNGFLDAYLNHYPIRIKPDDIWLLIVQAFSHHVNANSEELRNYFVNFDGKKTIKISYVDKVLDISQIDKKILESENNGKRQESVTFAATMYCQTKKSAQDITEFMHETSKTATTTRTR